MRYLLSTLILFLFSCDFFDDESDELGTCVIYELNLDYDPPINIYSCWDNVPQVVCSGDWYLNQSCLEFCEEKQIEEYTLCNDY